MTPTHLALLVAAVTIASGLTIWALTAAAVPPLAILAGALVLSVAARAWAKRR